VPQNEEPYVQFARRVYEGMGQDFTGTPQHDEQYLQYMRVLGKALHNAAKAKEKEHWDEAIRHIDEAESKTATTIQPIAGKIGSVYLQEALMEMEKEGADFASSTPMEE
jgi:hypothetical protein